jgi:cephalosporin-C deacetylase
MPLTDLGREALARYRCTTPEPASFDAFWERTLAEHAAGVPEVAVEPARTPLRTVDVADVTFAGYAGTPVKGWLLLPHGAEGPLPCVVEIPGYGGGRGLPHESLVYSAAGYAHFVMDLRGQGAHWLVGDTPDTGADPGPHFPGFMTSGITDPERYYYRRVIIDAVRAVQAARAHPAIDADRVAVMGGSAGGGVALAVAGLGAPVRGLIADVPFLCDIRRGCDVATRGPYLEIADFLRVRRDQVEPALNTLGHVDGVFFARRATVPAIFSVALMDPICPPSTVRAAFREYAGPAELHEWPYNGHEGGEGFQQLRRLEFLAGLFEGR